MGKNLKIAVLMDLYSGMLTKKQQDVLDLYYNEDLSLFEISEHYGITRQGVRDIIKRGEGILIDTEDRLKFIAKFEDDKNKTSEIIALIDTINRLNNQKIHSRILNELLNQIATIVQNTENT